MFQLVLYQNIDIDKPFQRSIVRNLTPNRETMSNRSNANSLRNIKQ